jgi:hypothetical protein
MMAPFVALFVFWQEVSRMQTVSRKVMTLLPWKKCTIDILVIV